MKLVFLFDAHLAEGAWAGKDVCGDAYYSALQVVDYAIAQQAAAVFSAGDLLDRAVNMSRPVNVLMKLLDKLQAADIPFYGIDGQHERADPPWMLQHTWARSLDKQMVEFGPLRIYGLSYRESVELAAELNEIPEQANVLLAHQAWEECKAAMAVAQASASLQIPGNIHTLITGDYHRNCDVTSVNRDQKPLRILSGGSTCLQSIDEPTQKYFMVWDSVKGFRFKKLKTRQVVATSEITDEDTLEQFLAQAERQLEEGKDYCQSLPAALQRPLLLTRVSRSLPKAESRLRRLGARFNAHVLVGNPRPPKYSADLAATENPGTEETVKTTSVTDFLLSALREELDPAEHPQAYSLCASIVTSTEPPLQVVRAWARKELGEE